MGSFLLRVEGVNFDATVYETDDISTIRGASLALLRLGDHVLDALTALPGVQNPELVFNGASQAVLTGETSLSADALRQQVADRLAGVDSPPFSALTTVVDVVEVDGKDMAEATRQAEARNASRQFRQWTIEPQPFFKEAQHADSRDRVRPVRAEKKTNDQLAKTNDQKEKINDQRKKKKEFGREARQTFYKQELQELLPSGTGVTFTDDLQDMIANAPPDVPETVRSKIAVFYADGNDFGKHRKGDLTAFSEDLKQKRRALLAKIIQWYDTNRADAAFTNNGDFRLETLLWGGDEMLFVLPAWLAWKFVQQVADEIKGWSFQGKPLTHAMGLVIANVKTPIRQLRAIAQWSADSAKDADLRDRNTVTIEVFESLSPPERIEDFHAMREQRYGKDEQMPLPRWLALPVDALAAETAGLPRSQLYKTLRKTGGRLLGEDATKAVTASFKEYQQRTGYSLPATLLPAVDDSRPLPLTLAMLADLWDYLPPADEEACS